MANKNRYARIMEHIFAARYERGVESAPFKREEISAAADELGIKLPKNLGDVVYSFRHRNNLPERIRATAPADKEWLIAARGRGAYAFELRRIVRILPDEMLIATKIPDATPGIVERYALNDE